MAEKIASVYIGLFVTRLAGSASGETAAGVSAREVEPGAVLDFAQRLVDGRHSHFEGDPFFTDVDGSEVEEEERGCVYISRGFV